MRESVGGTHFLGLLSGSLKLFGQFEYIKRLTFFLLIGLMAYDDDAINVISPLSS